jgi:hypothetical protein
MKVIVLRKDNKAAANKVLPKAGERGFYVTIVLNQTLVFQINSCGERPRLMHVPNVRVYCPTALHTEKHSKKKKLDSVTAVLQKKRV